MNTNDDTQKYAANVFICCVEGHSKIFLTREKAFE
jgi:hypothetical protein